MTLSRFAREGPRETLDPLSLRSRGTRQYPLSLRSRGSPHLMSPHFVRRDPGRPRYPILTTARIGAPGDPVSTEYRVFDFIIYFRVL